MFDKYAVQFAVEYLDKCLSKREQATLVGMIRYVDAFERVVAQLDEVNDALAQRPLVRLQRIEGKVIFDVTGSDRTVTPEDMAQAHADYIRESCAEGEKLIPGYTAFYEKELASRKKDQKEN